MMTPEFILRRGKINQALQSVGNTPDEIATFLEGQGVQGQLRNGNLCPMAVYLAKLFDAYEVEVGMTLTKVTLAVEHPDDGTDYMEIQVSHPHPVTLFVDAFDAGNYPNLQR